MPEKYIFKLLSKSVAAAASDTLVWTADADYRLHHIHGYDQDFADLHKVIGTVKIAEKILTLDKIDLAFFGPSELGALDFNVDFRRGERIEFAVTNDRGVTVTVNFILELERV